MAYREVTIGGVKGIAVLLREGFLKVVLEDGHTLILATADPSAKLGKVFNEDQPRDDDGRFASGGGGAHESDQDRTSRRFSENYQRVQQDIETATDAQIDLAISYATRVAINAQPKAWAGDAQAKQVMEAMFSEADSLKFALRMRREARKMDGSGGGWSAPTSATSGIAGYELGGERRRRKPKKQRNSLNLDPHSGAKAM